MPADLPDEWIDRLERLAEGDLGEEERALLSSYLREHPQHLATVRHHLVLAHSLAALPGAEDEDRFAREMAEHVAKVAAEGEFGFARSVTRRVVRRRVLAGLAVAAVATLAALPFLRQSPGPQVAVLVSTDTAAGTTTATPVHAGQSISRDTGLVRLDFAHGAVVAIEGPARFTVTSAMELRLHSGRLNAWCPEASHGFRVKTPTAELTDLGTSFGVNAGATDSEFIVLDGSVEVSKNGETRRLTRGDAVATSRREKSLRPVRFNPSGFKRSWPLSLGIIATKGAVVPADPDIPEKLALVESDDHVLVIPERRAVPWDHPIRVNIIAPGTLPGDLVDEALDLPPQPGKKLSSFLIRYDPVGTFPRDHFIRFEGEVTFDRPVAAILTKGNTLSRSDADFALREWNAQWRGIELKQLNGKPDSVTLTPDRRTVKVIFYAGAAADEIRVLLED